MEIWYCLGFLIGLALVLWLISVICNCANEREGCKPGTAVVISLFFTPIAGFLYVSLFPYKNREEQETFKVSEITEQVDEDNTEEQSEENQGKVPIGGWIFIGVLVISLIWSFITL